MKLLMMASVTAELYLSSNANIIKKKKFMEH